MAELLGYGKGWNPRLDDILEPVTARTAKSRHERGARYAAIFDDGNGRAVVGIDDESAMVEFWDSGAELRLSHQFLVVAGQLFVSDIVRFGRDLSRGGGIDTYRDDFLWAPGQKARWERSADVQPFGVLALRAQWDFEQHRFPFPEFGDYDYLLDPTLLDRLWPGHDQPPATDLGAELRSRLHAVVTARRLGERIAALKQRYREWGPIQADVVEAVLAGTGRRWRVEPTDKARLLAIDVPGGRIEAMILTRHPTVPPMTFQPGHAALLTVNFSGLRATWTDRDPRPDPSAGPYRGWMPPFTPPDAATFSDLVVILQDGLDALARAFTDRPFELSG